MSPDDENAVLSQDDIDALISSGTDIGGEGAAPALAAPPAEPPPAVVEVEPAAAAASPSGASALAAMSSSGWRSWRLRSLGLARMAMPAK